MISLLTLSVGSESEPSKIIVMHQMYRRHYISRVFCRTIYRNHDTHDE